MDRIDALKGFSKERLTTMTGGVLDPNLDAQLQELVAEASDALGMPIALVSLVLERTQFFRAHVGLPPDLVVSQATDRDASFCQFVVRDGVPFEVVDSHADDRVPKDLVDRYGIRSYLGYPVSVDGSVVGSICTIDTIAREFSPEDHARLEKVSARVTTRLNELARLRASTSRALVSKAASPVFGELRNIITLLSTSNTLSRVAVSDLTPLVSSVRSIANQPGVEFPALGCLNEAEHAVEDLSLMLGEIESASGRLVQMIGALEALLIENTGSTSLLGTINAALQLAHHHTKLRGVVELHGGDDVEIATPRMIAVSVISAAINFLSEEISENANIHVSTRIDERSAYVDVVVDASQSEIVDRALERLGLMSVDQSWVTVTRIEDGISMRFALSRA